MIDYWRQLDLVQPGHLTRPVTIIGAGGIGSPVALALAKMGCQRITIFDADTVESHNLPNQLYRLGDLGRPKVEALADLLREYAPVDVTAIYTAVYDQALNGIVICAVDTMAARAQIWQACVRFRAAVDLYVDARMGAQVGRVLAIRPVDPDDVRAYETTLYTDAMAAEDACTAQAIIYNTFGIAALVARQVANFARNQPVELDTILDLATLTLVTGVARVD